MWFGSDFSTTVHEASQSVHFMSSFEVKVRTILEKVGENDTGFQPMTRI